MAYNGNYNKRYALDLQRYAMRAEMESFKAHWQELGNLIHPRRPRFYTSDVNKGDRRNTNIVNGVATLASRTLVAGMKAGITSPAREWYRLGVADQGLMSFAPVKRWLHEVTTRMHARMRASNLYGTVDKQYKDLGTFGVAAMGGVEDNDTTLSWTSAPIGSYSIACNARGKVNSFERTFRMTVRQLLDEYGVTNDRGEITNWHNFSPYVKDQAKDDQRLETWIEVCWIVTPNRQWSPYGILSRDKRWHSCVFETGVGEMGEANKSYNDDSDARNRYLSESGFDKFPFLVPRWETAGEDWWPTDCPGMTALADIKQLQTQDKRLAQAIEKMINPPLKAGVGMRHSAITLLPGQANFLAERDVKDGLAPVHEVMPPVREMSEAIEKIERRVSRAYYEDLFLMLAMDTRNQRATAAEIEAKEREKLFALGPVLEQLDTDQNDPMVDMYFDAMWKQGDIPKPPQELEGMPIKVEYSIMAQAQKMAGVSTVERFIGTIGQLIAGTQDMSAVDSINVDKLVQRYGDRLGLDPDIIRSDDEITAIREQRAQIAAQQAQAEALQKNAAAMKDLSETKTDTDSALTRMAALSRGQG